MREFVEGEWKEAHFERYKPSTKKGVRSLLAGRILPSFGSKRLDRIRPARVRSWFDAFSRTAPGNANHALDLLRQIMNCAVACGHIEKNPTQGIRPNRRPRLTRFLSREEIGRLHRVAYRPVLKYRSPCNCRRVPLSRVARSIQQPYPARGSSPR